MRGGFLNGFLPRTRKRLIILRMRCLLTLSVRGFVPQEITNLITRNSFLRPNNLIDQPVLFCFHRGHIEIAIGVPLKFRF